MYDQALVWNTDSKLQVTSLTARLRGLAGIGTCRRGLHVSDLWGNEEPLAVAIAAHRWALDGETLSFQTSLRGHAYQVEVQPLTDLSGAVIGVAGRATELHAVIPIRPGAVEEAERCAGIGTWCEDLRTGSISISDGLAALLGVPRTAAGVDVRAFDHPEDRERIAAELADAEGDSGYSCDHRVLCASGRVRSVRERVRTILDDRGLAVARIGTLIDISDLKDREAELSELALYDALTRLPNRVALEERMQAAIARCARAERRCAVLFIDLDDFKNVNDAYGHGFGDRVLVHVAERLSRHVRASDTVARLGGDEFVVLVDDLFTDDAALDAARKLLRSLDDPFTVDGRSVRVSASIGVSTSTRCGSTPKELLDAADGEMYAIKRNGGSGVKLAAAREERASAPNESAECPIHYLPENSRFAIAESA